MKIEIAGIDTEKGLELYGGDSRIYLAVLRSYISSTPETLEKMRNITDLSDANLPDISSWLHFLKGSNAAIGAEETRKAGIDLEEKAKTGDFSKFLPMCKTFIDNSDVLLANIKKFLAQAGN